MTSDNTVQIQGRHARWSFRVSCSSTRKESEPFKFGIWNWILSAEYKQKEYSTSVIVRLFPAESVELPPLAHFSLDVSVNGTRKSTEHNGLIRTCDDFTFTYTILGVTQSVDVSYDVEFLDLKISSLEGGEDIFIWPIDERSRETARMSTLKPLTRMLDESLFTDITINTADGGKLHAHRAVLSANSPVFHSMFVHDLKEKQSSTIDIDDMTSESCKALLNFMYGSTNTEYFWKHRLALVTVADKYNIPDLMDRCVESLLKDIGMENVIERLQAACLYQLSKLKKGCLSFLRNADTELVEELVDKLFQEAHESSGVKRIERGEEKETN